MWKGRGYLYISRKKENHVWLHTLEAEFGLFSFIGGWLCGGGDGGGKETEDFVCVYHLCSPQINLLLCLSSPPFF